METQDEIVVDDEVESIGSVNLVEETEEPLPENINELIDNIEINESEIKIPKKRGRKPKIKEEDVKVLKKRGRKPKEKIYSIKDINKAFFDESKNETLILHLPIKKNDNINDEPIPINKHELHFFNFDDEEYILDNKNIFENDNLVDNKETLIKKK